MTTICYNGNSALRCDEGRGSVHCIFQRENRSNLLTYSGICNRQEKKEEEYGEGLGVEKILYIYIYKATATQTTTKEIKEGNWNIIITE